MYQMYINKKDICYILYLVYVSRTLFLPLLQTINLCGVDFIIITFSLFDKFPLKLVITF